MISSDVTWPRKVAAQAATRSGTYDSERLFYMVLQRVRTTEMPTAILELFVVVKH